MLFYFYFQNDEIVHISLPNGKHVCFVFGKLRIHRISNGKPTLVDNVVVFLLSYVLDHLRVENRKVCMLHRGL